ncbi:hypothetical protein COOONC_18509 [Cooperia oncophora]
MFDVIAKNSESSKVEHREENAVKESTNWVPTMFFATGPGFRNGFGDHSSTDIEQPFYRQPTAVRTQFGYHGGEDVGIWADGPFSELFSSSLENTEVAYIVKFLLCLSTTDFTICDIPSKSEVLSRDSRDPARLNALEKGYPRWDRMVFSIRGECVKQKCKYAFRENSTRVLKYSPRSNQGGYF